MNSFHFLRPEWFLALLPTLLLLWWLARRRLRSRSWQAVCDPELLPHLLLGRSVRRANWPHWLLLLGLLLAILALAGPVWQHQPQPLFRQHSALVVLFDLSRSMQVADLKPNRFMRARLKIEDLLRQRQEGQTALIVFAADAFTVTPLTEDRHTIEALLKSLDPEMMPAQGSNPARAIQLGQELLQQAGLKSGRLLLVTDEDRPEHSLDAAHSLVRQGFELAVLGVGSSEGAPIPQPGGGFFKDAQGNLVLPQLNRSGLKELAAAGGGNYRKLSIDDSDLHELLAGLDDRRLDQGDSAEQTSSTTGDLWREEGVWLLWPLTLLAALAFRRGWLLVLTLVLLVPPPAEALSWSELWQTPDQQAAQAFEQQDYPKAAAQFQDSRWKASALYRSGQFEAAAKQLADPQSADDWYNQGNALAKGGDLTAALDAYRQALEIEPEHTDAEFNKGLVEKALEQQEQQQQERQPGDKNEQGEQQEDSEDNQSSSDEGEQSRNQQSSADQQNQDRQQEQQNEVDAGDDKSADSESETEEGQSPESAAAESEQAGENEEPEEQTGATAEPAEETAENDEQRESRLLLQQIPDDPGGLLRRKFLYQYRQRGQQRETDRSW
jgi:Ca-activated chloride channel family protein